MCGIEYCSDLFFFRHRYDKQLFETGMCRKNHKHLYVYQLQCVVSNGETTSLVLVKGCANIGVVQKNKKKEYDKNSRNYLQ